MTARWHHAVLAAGAFGILGGLALAHEHAAGVARCDHAVASALSLGFETARRVAAACGEVHAARGAAFGFAAASAVVGLLGVALAARERQFGPIGKGTPR